MIVTVEDNRVTDVAPFPLDVLRWSLCSVDLTDKVDMRQVMETTRAAIEKAMTSADDRPVAMRVRFTGAAAIYNEISAYPEQFEQTIKALGAEIGGDDLWIEKVENNVATKMELQTALSEDNAFGKLLTEILETSDDPGEIKGLNELITKLRKKIPPEAFNTNSDLKLDDEHTIGQMIREAKQMLVSRLLSTGGNQ